MIVGVGIETKWGMTMPCFDNLGDGYYFYWEGEEGQVDAIEKLDYKEFLEWMPEGEFKDDTLRLKDQSFNGVMTQLMFHGCEGSRQQFSSLMNKYYERNS